MLLTKKSRAGRSVSALLFLVVLATSAFAEGYKQNVVQQRQVGDQLAEFKTTAFALRREADTLNSPGARRWSWQTQSQHLQNIANQVNRLGKSLAELESMHPVASDGQRVAIEHARTHLVCIAQNTTRAIELMRENRASVRFADFGEAVSDLQAHAETMHSKLDTILDFEDARMRLEDMDLQPRLTEGS